MASYTSPLFGLEEQSCEAVPYTQGLFKQQQRMKAIQDRVYGQIRIPMAVVDVMNTPAVQRLRGLMQLGNTHFLYPAATHTRFERSVGVSYLAMRMLRELECNHMCEDREGDVYAYSACRSGATLGQQLFTEKDVLCLGIAGLCHDLGHGPLSHMFEDFVNGQRRQRKGCKPSAPVAAGSGAHHRTDILDGKANVEEREGCDAANNNSMQERYSYNRPPSHGSAEGWGPVRRPRWASSTPPPPSSSPQTTRELDVEVSGANVWKHEQTSSVLIDHIWTEIGDDLYCKYQLDNKDLAFIKLLIRGLRENEPWPGEGVVGRDAGSRYMTDIVANKRNGIDVDKIDYIIRDSICCLGTKPDLSLERLLHATRVIEVRNRTEICFNRKIESLLRDLFNYRAKLYKTIYHHRVVKAIDRMVLDAFNEAEGHFFIEVMDRGGTRKVSLSQTVDSIDAFLLTGDWVIQAIMVDQNPALSKARNLLWRIHQRRIYASIGMIVSRFGKKTFSSSRFECLLREYMRRMRIDEDARDIISSLIVATVNVVIGSSTDEAVCDPLSNVRFFNSNASPDVTFNATARKRAMFYPNSLAETLQFLFYPQENEEVERVLRSVFNEYTQELQPKREVVEANVRSQPSSPNDRKRQRSVSSSSTTPTKPSEDEEAPCTPPLWATSSIVR